jgi:hypothetical protein
MTESAIRDRRLNLVRLSLCLSARSHDTRVLFDVRVAGENAGLLDAAATEIGLPLSSSEVRSSASNEENYKMPDYIVTALNSMLPPGGAPLWLVFDSPTGYLPMIPWERLLGKLLGCPILRAPYFDLQPVVSRNALDVVLCLSFPIAKQEGDRDQVLVRFLDEFPNELAKRTSLHVFADRGVQHLLTNLPARYSRYEVKVYDPQEASGYALPERSSDVNPTEELASPWLLWMRDALSGRSIDLVHFVCHGYFRRDHGALAFAESPVVNEDENWARFVGARELAKFLDQTGAWSAAFSSPPENFCVGGLRLLQEQMARLRPGPFLFHEMRRDHGGKALSQAYQILYLAKRSVLPNSEAVTIYCNPGLIMSSDPSASTRSGPAGKLVEEFTLAGRFPETLEGIESTPSWLASWQRSLERSAATLATEPTSDEQAAAQRGTEAALRFAADAYARHAAEWAKKLGKEMK